MIPYRGQLRYGGVHEFDPADVYYTGVYNPVVVESGGASLQMAASTDTAQDWENVLRCVQSAAGEDAYLEYGLGIIDHGQPDLTVPTFQHDRDHARIVVRVRVPTAAFGAAEVLPFMVVRSETESTEHVRVGFVESGGSLYLRVRDSQGATNYTGTTALTAGDWYDVELEVDARSYTAGALRAWVRPAGGAWTSEVDQSGLSTLRDVGVIRLGAIGTLKENPSGTHVVEVHSWRWAFDHYFPGTYTNSTQGGYLTATDHADLRIDGTEDVWWGVWARVEATGGDHVLIGKGNINVDEEWEIFFNSSTGKVEFHVSANATTRQVVVGPVITPYEWHFILAWYDANANTINIRFDDGANVSAAFTGTPRTSTNPVHWGRRVVSGSSSNWWNGTLAYTAMGKLTAGSLAAQIDSIQTTLYNSGQGYGEQDLTSGFATSSGLLHMWPLDDADATYFDRNAYGTPMDLSKTGQLQSKAGPKRIYSADQAEVRGGAYEFPGSRIADVSPTEAQPLLLLRQGQWRGVTHARVVYGTASDLTGGTATAWENVSSVGASTAYIHIFANKPTGLSSNTRYYWRIELSRDGSTAHVQGPINSFLTMPAIGATDRVNVHHYSCVHRYGPGLVHRDIEKMLDWGEANSRELHRSTLLGDLYYEVIDGEWVTGTACHTTDQYVKHALAMMYDPTIVRLAGVTATPFQPSDHEVINGVESSLRLDTTTRASLANNWSSKKATYPAGTTLGDVYDAAEPLLLYWEFNPRLSTVKPTGVPVSLGSGADFSKANVINKYGRVWEAQLDIIYTASSASSNDALGATVTTWLEGQIDAFQADPDADMFLFSVDTGMTSVLTKSGGWMNRAAGELKALCDYIDTNVVDPDKGVVAVGGDNHAGVWAERAFEGAGGFLCPTWAGGANSSPLKVNIGSSPTSAVSAWGALLHDPSDPAYADYVGPYWDPTRRYGLEQGTDRQIRNSGAMTSIDGSAGTIDVKYWTDFGREYDLLTGFDVMAAAGSTRPAQPTITADLTGTTLTLTSSAFQGNGLTHSESRWEVQLTGGDWSSPQYAITSGVDLLSHIVDVSGWPDGTYEARVRHRGE